MPRPNVTLHLLMLCCILLWVLLRPVIIQQVEEIFRVLIKIGQYVL